MNNFLFYKNKSNCGQRTISGSLRNDHHSRQTPQRSVIDRAPRVLLEEDVHERRKEKEEKRKQGIERSQETMRWRTRRNAEPVLSQDI